MILLLFLGTTQYLNTYNRTNNLKVTLKIFKMSQGLVLPPLDWYLKFDYNYFFNIKQTSILIIMITKGCFSVNHTKISNNCFTRHTAIILDSAFSYVNIIEERVGIGNCHKTCQWPFFLTF